MLKVRKLVSRGTKIRYSVSRYSVSRGLLLHCHKIEDFFSHIFFQKMGRRSWAVGLYSTRSSKKTGSFCFYHFLRWFLCVQVENGNERKWRRQFSFWREWPGICLYHFASHTIGQKLAIGLLTTVREPGIWDLAKIQKFCY